MRALAPCSLLLICWGAALTATGWTLSNLERFDLVALFMRREGLTLGAFSWIGAAWLCAAVSVYFVTDAATRKVFPPLHRFQMPASLDRLAQVTFRINLMLLGVTLLWVLSTASKLGGLQQLVNLAYLDSLGARDLLLDNKLFTGMRLFYAALPGTGCLAAAILCSGNLSRRNRARCRAVLILNAVALLLLPLVMSQRLLLLQFLLSAYLAGCLVKGRLFGIGWLVAGAAAFLVIWVLRESVTNPLIERNAFDLGMQKLAFYFANDIWNAFAPLQVEIEHTFGAVSLRGLMFLTFTDNIFLGADPNHLNRLDFVLGGGDFPFFTALYVDFGILGGSFAIMFCAVIFRCVYQRALQSFGWAVIYAQLGATLLFSSHGIYFTHQNFLFSLAVICACFLMSRRSLRLRVSASRGRAKSHANYLRPPLSVPAAPARAMTDAKA